VEIAGRKSTHDVAKRPRLRADGGNVSKEVLITTCCEPQMTATAFNSRKLLDRPLGAAASAARVVASVAAATEEPAAATSSAAAGVGTALLTLLLLVVVGSRRRAVLLRGVCARTTACGGEHWRTMAWRRGVGGAKADAIAGKAASAAAAARRKA
jgi:hypothetical protein